LNGREHKLPGGIWKTGDGVSESELRTSVGGANGATLDLVGRGDGEGVPEPILGPRGVLVAELLFQRIVMSQRSGPIRNQTWLGEALWFATVS